VRRERGMSFDVAFYLPSLGPLLSPAEELPCAGGAETQIWLLARGLAQRGARVCVVVTNTPRGLPREVDGVTVVVRPPLRAGRGIRGKAAEVHALWRTLAPLDAQVVVQRTAGISTGLVAVITRLKRRRFVYSSANVIDFDFDALASTAIELRLFNLGVRLAETIVVQTDEQAHRCLERFRRHPTVIGSIAEPAATKTGIGDAFLWVGRLIGYKQPHAFLDLALAVPEARFRMVGLPAADDPGLAAEVEERASGIDNVELLGPRSRPQLLALYDAAVAVVNTADFEGMPNIFLEGWSRGVPALALSHDPDKVIVTHGLGAFARGSPAELADLARLMWSSRHDQLALAVRCVEYVQRSHNLETALTAWIDALRVDGATPALPALVRPLDHASSTQLR